MSRREFIQWYAYFDQFKVGARQDLERWATDNLVRAQLGGNKDKQLTDFAPELASIKWR